jgi:transposase InsO family protein
MDRLAAIAGHRVPRYRPALAAPPLPRVLDPALASAYWRSSSHRYRDAALIRKVAAANPLWGAPRIHGELLKLGIEISVRNASRLMSKRRPEPSQTWRTFLANHIAESVSIDFFTVPTARLRVLFVLVVLAHHRRRVVHFNVTEHPTAAWTARQIVDTFPEDSAPAYLLRDRDCVYGQPFRRRVKGMRIEEVLTAPHSPWQNPFVEQLIGSIRRECLNHVLVLSERHLRRILTRYFSLLPSGAYPPRAGQGRARPQANRVPRGGEDRAASRSRRPAPSLHPSGCVAQRSRSCVAPNGGDRPGVACSLSSTRHESAGTGHGRRSKDPGRPVPDPPRGRGVRIPNGHEGVGRGFGEAQASGCCVR